MYRDNARDARARLDAALQRRDAARAAANEQRDAIVELDRQLDARGKPGAELPPQLTPAHPHQAIDGMSLAELLRAAAAVEEEAARFEKLRDENAALVKLLSDRVLGRAPTHRMLREPPRAVPLAFIPQQSWLGWFGAPLLVDLSVATGVVSSSRGILWTWAAALLLAGACTWYALRTRRFLRWAKVASSTLLDAVHNGYSGSSEDGGSNVQDQARGWEFYSCHYTGPLYRNRVRFITGEGLSGDIFIDGMEYAGGVVLYDASRKGAPLARAVESFSNVATPWPMPDERGHWLAPRRRVWPFMLLALIWLASLALLVR